MKKSQSLLIFGIFSFLVSGLIDQMAPRFMSANYFIHILIIAVMAFSWVAIHAKENSVTPPKAAKVLSALILPIGIPYYLFGGYGFKQGGIKVLVFLAILILSMLLYELPAKFF